MQHNKNTVVRCHFLNDTVCKDMLCCADYGFVFYKLEPLIESPLTWILIFTFLRHTRLLAVKWWRRGSNSSHCRVMVRHLVAHLALAYSVQYSCGICPRRRRFRGGFAIQTSWDGSVQKTFLVAQIRVNFIKCRFLQELQQYEYQTCCPTRYCLTIGQPCHLHLKKPARRTKLVRKCK